MCFRSRNTEKYLKSVGEVRHGCATGHIWECRDIKDCENVIEIKLSDRFNNKKNLIRVALQRGRFTDYKIVV